MALRRNVFAITVVFVTFISSLSAPSLAREQAQATPEVPGDVCFFPREAPLIVNVEANHEAVISFDSDCHPIIEYFPIDPAESAVIDAESSMASPLRRTMGDAVGGDTGSEALFSHTGSSICNASLTVHDPVHWTLTHTRVYGRWYWNDHAVTGRGNGSTSESHAPTGWEVNDGPWFFWYMGPTTPQGHEGWTAFNWIGGAYWHEQRAINTMYPNGYCTSQFQWAGSIASGNHMHQRNYIS
jgi:hypothetical protein